MAEIDERLDRVRELLKDPDFRWRKWPFKWKWTFGMLLLWGKGRNAS